MASVRSGTIVFVVSIAGMVSVVNAGPYNERGVHGFVGDDWREADPWDSDAVLNPMFRGWAAEAVSYEPAPGVGPDWDDPWYALGPVTGDHLDIVSLGDLSSGQIASGVPCGRITLSFDAVISDGAGYDFVVFENGYAFVEMFAELGYVEVSSDNTYYVRFAGVSLTPEAVGNYGMIYASDVYGLAGKHQNGYGICRGTPFDLRVLAGEPNVMAGLVDINNINYVRIVDIPGSGDFVDEASEHVDPCSWPEWGNYDGNHPIYDAWETYDSGGFDLEAIGVLHPQEYRGDINLDGIVDLDDLHEFAWAWQEHFGESAFSARCDVAGPRDYVVDLKDFAVLAGDWGAVEQWRK